MNRPDVTDLDALLLLQRTGTLSAAAKQRGVAVSTISRRIAALEEALGLTLVHRQPRGTTLAAAGIAIADAAVPIIQPMDELCRLAETLTNSASRRSIRISATEFIVAEVLAPQLPALIASTPPIAVALCSEIDVVSLGARDADIAVRMVRPDRASLIVRKLPQIGLSLYASAAYLNGRAPKFISLANVPLLIYDPGFGAVPETQWVESHGLTGSVVMRTNSIRGLTSAVLSGAGVALLPDVVAARHAALVRVESELQFPARIPYLTIAPHLQSDRSGKAVANWVAASFARYVAG